MRIELEISLLINRYIENDLGYEEKLIFEKRLAEDSSFREEFELQKMVNQVIIGASEQALRERMSSDISNLEKRSLRNKTLIAASILLLVSAALFVWLQQNPQKTDVPEIPSIHAISKPYIKDSVKVQTDSGNHRKSNAPSTIVNSKPKIDSFIANPLTVGEKKPNETQIISVKPADSNIVVFKQPEVSEYKSDPCKTFALEANPKIINTCPDTHDGKIDFTDKSSIKGGKSPYLISRDNGQSFKPIGILYGLPSGSQHIIIKDANGCLHPLDLLVSVKECSENKFAFNPDFGEVWKVPAASGLGYSVLIYGRSKELVFKHSSNGSGNFEWSGINSNGTLLEAGLYAYIIEYDNGKREYGQVSIIR